MWTIIAIAATLYSFGVMTFGRFEGETPLLARARKLVIYLGVTALLAAWVGPWALIWVFVPVTVGMVFHFVWCARNGIHPLTAEPKARYYQLRGWKLS